MVTIPASYRRYREGQFALGGNDNHLAKCPTLTDMSKRGGDLVESEGAVDVNPDVAGDAQLGEWLELGRILVDKEHTHQRPVSLLTAQPTVTTRSSAPTDPPTHRYVPPGASARR